MSVRSRSIFVNCPFDAGYKPLFDAIVFTVTACNFVVRSALEVSDAGELRLAKIVRLIGESRFSIHNISRIELDGDSGLPRFNMPIELGIAIGAKYLGDTRVRDHLMLVLDSERYRFQRFASDLAGLDPSAHANSVDGVVSAVRNFVAAQSATALPGAAAIKAQLATFEATLPGIATAVGQRLDELTYTDRMLHLNDFLASSL